MAQLVVGLTGGVACGKSLAGESFLRLGVPVCDADQVSRDIVAPGMPALDEIVSSFGKAVLLDDGSLDRPAMRRIIFNDEAARHQLGRITHGRIQDALRSWRDRCEQPLVVLMVPILVESGMQSLVDRILLIDVDEETQLRRLMSRDDIDETLAMNMIRSQMTSEQRRANADDVIINAGPASALDSAVRHMHAFYNELVSGDAEQTENRTISTAIR